MLNRIKVVITAAVLLGGVSASQASVIINVEQVGSNIVATGSGTLNINGLSSIDTGGYQSKGAIQPGYGFLIFGNGSSYVPVAGWEISQGPVAFGSDLSVFLNADTGNGSVFGIAGSGWTTGHSTLFTPVGYTSGSLLSSSSTWNNQTYDTMKATLGTYKWTWGSEVNADSLTLNIGPAAPTAVPEPSTFALLSNFNLSA